MHYFWVAGSIFDAPLTLCIAIEMSQKLVVFSFRASFVGNNALFWSPELIFDTPLILFTAIEMSQKLVVFVVPGEFHGL